MANPISEVHASGNPPLEQPLPPPSDEAVTLGLVEVPEVPLLSVGVVTMLPASAGLATVTAPASLGSRGPVATPASGGVPVAVPASGVGAGGVTGAASVSSASLRTEACVLPTMNPSM